LRRSSPQHVWGRVTYRIERSGIDAAKHFNYKTILVTGQVEPDSGNQSFQMSVIDLADLEVMKE
jgi:hypothetical protein